MIKTAKILFFILIPFFCQAEFTWKSEVKEGCSIEVMFSASSLSIDDVLKAEVTLTYPKQFHPDLHKLKQNLMKFSGLGAPPFLISSEKIDPPELMQDKKKQKVTFTLEPQLPGDHYLTFLDVVFLPNDPKGGKKIVIISDLFPFTISMPARAIAVQDLIAPLMPLTKQQPIAMSDENKKLLTGSSVEANEAQKNRLLLTQKAFPWEIIVFFFVGGLVFLLSLGSTSKKDKHESLLKTRNVKASAIHALNDIKSKQLIEKAAYDEFFVQLSREVREYIEEKYHLRAPTSTTQEFLRDVANNPQFDEQKRNLLMQFLEKSDYVKFAHYKPTKEECQQAEQAAREFINA